MKKTRIDADTKGALVRKRQSIVKSADAAAKAAWRLASNAADVATTVRRRAVKTAAAADAAEAAATAAWHRATAADAAKAAATAAWRRAVHSKRSTP